MSQNPQVSQAPPVSTNTPNHTEKETREEHIVLADPFCTRPFEVSAKCSGCSNSFSVKEQIQSIKNPV